MKRWAAALAAILWSSQAAGEFVAQNDSIALAAIANKFDVIASTTKLSATDAVAAKRLAVTWYYIGPCQQPTTGLPEQLTYEAMSMTASADPELPIVAATLQMIAIMSVQNLGRSAPNWLCDYAGIIASGPR
ncbi:hypothetical protein HFO82_21865 [Rhizobium leguminosarum]|uniref:hypothetical protein n=1 Tax=Rhizobium leguminosarum TaxID=384 RepID=UPI001C95589D|nr:hypothetical protein [Rhizobium leguminosarum]MBY5501246.1 hypothetical protein [Rhizobium leguminosarum]